MFSVLIIEKDSKKMIEIAKKIVVLFPKSDIIPSFNIENAIEIIKKQSIQVVVVSLDLKDSKGRDLLERLGNWEFEILINKNNEIYSMQDGKQNAKGGYVLKSIETK
ncbi:MAG: hypothetical protein RO257_16155 [Candidatus Kapabacteria bacterium]|nr:hypothetical protein [Candidatus Kapabacteria bacterium]